MASVITSFSRITILSYIIIFTAIDLIQIFEYKLNAVISNILSTIQAVMIVLFLCNSATVLYFVRNDSKIIILTIIELLFLCLTVYLLKSLSEPASAALINNVLLLTCFGFVALERLNFDKSIRHIINIFVSLFLAYIFTLIIRQIPEISRFMFVSAAIGIASLLAISLIGNVEYGAKLSFTIIGLRIQPSELVKITYPFFIAGCITVFRDFRGYLLSAIGTFLHVIILVYSRDLGSAFIFVTCFVFLTFIAYKNYVLLVIEVGGSIIGGIFAYINFPHIQTRFIAWSDPLSVIDDKGYQISQSLFAIGTGGWFGSGISNGMPTKIPVVITDFIFAAISEEMGAIVAICLIIIYMCTAILLFNISYRCNNSFYMLVCSGLAIIFATQTILNIGGVIKFIPSTGVTLPFISYGGSSLISMFIILFTSECSDTLWLNLRGKKRYEY